MNKQHFTQLIKSASFKELFNELGWENLSLSVPISIDDEKFNLNAVAEKRGFVIFVCSPDTNGKIPLSSIRKKIDQRITKLYYEHLIIYKDKENFQQIWQLVLRESDKPIVVRETPYFSTQQPELLFQKLRGLFISLDEEDKVTIADVRSNVREQFNTNAEKVTKKFYVEFKAQHTAFLTFIDGIEDKINKDWYASLMLNRLMFIYFIQKKGFLDSNPNYLRDKLKDVQKRKGKDKFFSFYRNFLLVLFHQGLGAPERSEKLLKEIGKVPYLNGGLFDVHQIEKDYKKIEIEDKAFDKIFKFFDEYNWHLDTKITATGRDINPDVIGYIFEKYINDRAAMGAYYTKEDITEYIAKNTVVPYLFDQVKKDCANAFKDESSLWKMLRDNPDRYIYDSVKHGIYDNVIASGAKQSELKIRELPKEIQIGLDTTKPNLLERRKDWNKAAPPEFALPTEIWREVVERRNRYFDVKTKIENGEIKEINDFITYNLNIRQFAQDAVQQYEGSDFINAFYKAITKITVLDPTCGSGAFLFAALNILEPLYYGCIERMKGFIEEDDKQNGKKFSQFRKVLEEITKHPNQQYYIYKSIILNNLYGVDIMNEAVEIAKLRLFLKLVAEVEDFENLEPLPDIDFNVRCGNTLIGYATKQELDKGLTWSLNLGVDTKKIYDELDVVAKAFKRYKEIQLEDESKHTVFKKSKDELNERLKKLNESLNDYLGNDYGKSRKKKKEFEEWLKSHQPFHWFAEFYEIIERGGFDIVIGNPPYVEYSTIRKKYTLNKFVTLGAGNLYAYVIERSLNIQKVNSFNGMIIPLSAYCTDRMEALQNFQTNLCKNIWLSNFAERPSKLFEGAERNLTISLLNKAVGNGTHTIFTTGYYKWNAQNRLHLFNSISYIVSSKSKVFGIVPKISSDFEIKVINVLRQIKRNVGSFTVSYSTSNILYYRNSGGRYWKIISDFQPKFFLNGKRSTSSRESYLFFASAAELKIIVSILSSSLFYWYYVMHSDARTNNPSDLKDFPFDINILSDKVKQQLISLCDRLMGDIDKNSIMQDANYQTGVVKFQQFFIQNSKPIIDSIDTVLAVHYGFTEEELDFIINYDIKYRMGKELEEECLNRDL
ncbi:MAG: Eco57I restriction-modification methylase domain-containing protein [Ignavibacteriales bacterium]|nr:Eco57I restriction-modification methylase domain-containing protein [Ignavibacteriales bacterium]